MSTPQLYRQLLPQLSQWITPKDKRHLTMFAENIAAILQAQSGCLSRWLTYLSHRSCHARSHLERLSYFVHNPKITIQTITDHRKLHRDRLLREVGSSLRLLNFL